MKRSLVVVVVFLSFAGAAFADETVRGYMKRDGTYVQPYVRSSPNSTPTDNYNFKGNINPYSGEKGSNSYRHNPRSPYYDGTPKNSKGLFSN